MRCTLVFNFLMWADAAAGFIVKTGKNALDAGTDLVPVRRSRLALKDHLKCLCTVKRFDASSEMKRFLYNYLALGADTLLRSEYGLSMYEPYCNWRRVFVES